MSGTLGGKCPALTFAALTFACCRRQVAPDHVVPGPEECYVYSPLGSAYKLQSVSEGHGKNSSVVTM